MQEMIAYCGLVCTGCPVFLATQSNDDEARKKVVEQWSSEQYPLKVEDINCDGCSSAGQRHIKFCSECEVRACGIEKKVDNCAYCDDFACDKLEKLWGMISSKEARGRLEEIRKTLNK